MLVLYVLKRRNYYRDNKYLQVIDPTSNGYEIVDHDDAAEMPINPAPTSKSTYQ
jgi:hypothetical protein